MVASEAQQLDDNALSFPFLSALVAEHSGLRSALLATCLLKLLPAPSLLALEWAGWRDSLDAAQALLRGSRDTGVLTPFWLQTQSTAL